MMHMTPIDFLEYLIKFTPSFKAAWESDENYFVEDDGTYTYHGVCTEFSHYFIDQEAHKYVVLVDRDWTHTISDTDLKEFFVWLEGRLEENETKKSLTNSFGLLSNAIYTCFLENISQTNAGEYAKQFMGKKARNYFDKWHVYSKKL